MSLRRNKAAKADNHERWLITYADLITLLLVFFIVLYAGSQEDSHKFAILAEGLRSAFNNPSNSGKGGQSAVFLGSGAANQGGVGQQRPTSRRSRRCCSRSPRRRGWATRSTSARSRTR